MNTKFPQPKYLGAKNKLIEWIMSYMPSDVRSAFESSSAISLTPSLYLS